MVTEKVIKEIYKKYSKPPVDSEELRIPYFLDILSQHHDLVYEDGEIRNKNLGEFDPFGRVLVRRLNAILEFDTVIAFVLDSHILFFERESSEMHVHFKPQSKGIFGRIFG